MKKRLNDVLLKIGKRLNDTDAVWAVGASLLLHQYGLCESPHDIDIFVRMQDIGKVKEAMDLLAEPKKQEKSSTY
ncbi:MAG: hypothetical protein AB1Z23_05205 [Eubacteriales bacterium]